MEIAGVAEMRSGSISGTSEMAILAIKYSVKAVSGIEDIDGNPYELEFDESNNLKEDCVDDLLNVELSSKLVSSCLSLLSGIPDKIIDPATGKALEGVTIDIKNSKKKK